MKRLVLLLAAGMFCSLASASYDADGVPLGASEKDVKKRFPSARCKELEWASMAADRRCDDGKAPFAGMETRVTFYLKKGAVVAFDVRFDVRFTERMASILKGRYGKPAAEERAKPERADAPQHEVYTVSWEGQGERAVLTSVSDQRKGSLLASRGKFEEEIYRVR